MNTQIQQKNVIVVGMDLSETGDNALREALRLSHQLPGSELHVVYVVATTKYLHDARKIEALAKDLPARLEELREHTSALCNKHEGKNAFTQDAVFHVRLGEPAAALHQAAVDVDADLIVVGTHGRKGVEKLILGSVAEELVRNARVPVIVARPKDYAGLARSPQPDARRPGEDLHAASVSARWHFEFRPRTSHISGLV